LGVGLAATWDYQETLVGADVLDHSFEPCGDIRLLEECLFWVRLRDKSRRQNIG
jgi:hypothetical protein